MLVIIFMLALYAVALACLNHACLGKRGGAAADNVEHVHAEQIGTVVNKAERKVLVALFVFNIFRLAHVKLFSHLSCGIFAVLTKRCKAHTDIFELVVHKSFSFTLLFEVIAEMNGFHVRIKQMLL